MRTTRRLVALALVGTIAYLGVTLVQVWLASRRDGAQRADAIVVLGAAQYNGRPSPVLAARLDHAASLYERGFADVIVVTGGRQPGDRFTEATASAKYLARRGVPDRSIMREVQGRSTWESLSSAARFLAREGRVHVVVVTDPFHAARAGAIADEVGLDAAVSPTRSSPIGGAEEMVHILKETLAVGAGRIVGYRRLT